jgi:4-hydroxy-4-methyl-2-oxoglutarate aldolase
MDVQAIATADLCDAAETLIAMDGRIRPTWEGARLAGPAFTIRVPPGENPSVRAGLDQAAPGDVIVIDGGGYALRALWGGNVSARARERGLAGAVVDGAVRDLDEIEAAGFPVFAAAVVPTPPGRELAGEIGVEISCGGLAVRPGDHVYGDRDGVVIVPAELHDELVDRVGAVRTTR